MAESSVVKKLGIKPGNKVLVTHAPEGYSLSPLPQGAEVQTNASGTFDLVQVFVRNKADITQHVAAAIKALKPGGMLWVTFPKKTGTVKSDLSRDSTLQTINESTGWQGVSLIAVDDTWSAMRFRREEDVKSRKK